MGKVKGNGESAKIQCMEKGCGRIVKGDVVDDLVSSEISKK